MLNTGMSITINGELLPLVMVDYRFAYCDAVCGIDERKLEVQEQVENCVEKLLRENYRRVALVKLVMGDENYILQLAKLFSEKNIEVACVYSNKLTLDQYKKLNPNFEYGVVNDWIVLAENAKEKSNNHNYKKSL